MSYLDELKKAVAAVFESAEDKKTVDQMVNINSLIKSAEDEQAQLMNKNKELIAAYKDAVMHPGISEKGEPDVTEIQDSPKLDFAEFVRKAVK